MGDNFVTSLSYSTDCWLCVGEEPEAKQTKHWLVSFGTGSFVDKQTFARARSFIRLLVRVFDVCERGGDCLLLDEIY